VLVAAGVEAQRAGDPDAAEKAFREVLAADPTEPRAVRHLGASLAERGETTAAIELFEATLERVGPPSKEVVAFYNNYANALRRAERYPAAEKLLRELVSIAPEAWQPWHNLGQMLRALGRLDDAAAAMQRAVSREPGFAPNHGVLGDILMRLGRLDEADSALQRCIELGGRSEPGVWTTIGATYRFLGRLDEAREAFEHVLALGGPTPAAHSDLGLVLGELGRFDEAIAQFNEAIRLEPSNDRRHAYRGYVLLAAGRLAEGWEEWEHGFEEGLRGRTRAPGIPRWTRADGDARVLVYREQGIGDELMFASCYPDIIAAARKVVIECDPRLVSLFARSFPDADVRAPTVDASGQETINDYDCAIPAGSLPRVFRQTIDAFPQRRVTVHADPDRVSEWHKALREIGRPPYVGIAWRSGIMTAERRREYTRLEEWGRIFAVPNVTWVNLQYDDCESELRFAEERFAVRLHRWETLDLMNDLDEVAALTTNLDVVVAPRSAVSMLSGALGVDTFALANSYMWPDLGTRRLPWLPAVRMIYRQPNGQWAPVLSAAADAIAEVARHTASPD
jgi:tetratricopeptide (TPR) repeat protein